MLEVGKIRTILNTVDGWNREERAFADSVLNEGKLRRIPKKKIEVITPKWGVTNIAPHTGGKVRKHKQYIKGEQHTTIANTEKIFKIIKDRKSVTKKDILNQLRSEDVPLERGFSSGNVGKYLAYLLKTKPHLKVVRESYHNLYYMDE